MFIYDKKLQYPVKIDKPNPKLASIIISQYGGPDGELGASLRYLSQRYSMPFDELKGLLTDIGTEELAHLEMIAAIIHQLTRNLTPSLSLWGKLIITGTMYLGRIGPISLAFAFSTRKENRNIIKNPVEEISVG